MTENAKNAGPWHELLDEVEEAWPQQRWQDLGVIVGCSGGADSVALLRILHHRQKLESEQVARGFLVAAHFNHGLRSSESDDDEAFVKELAKELNIPFACERSQKSDDDEASLRDQRYKYLEETACQFGARYIALAHSRDDNVETVLHHLMRGTGPAGLAGIQPSRNVGDDLVLVRPLLDTSRELIRKGLRSVRQSWREDSSNDNTCYRRNWIRCQLIPLIETEYPHAVEAVARAIETQGEWRTTIRRLAKEWIAHNQICDQPLTLARNVGPVIDRPEKDHPNFGSPSNSNPDSAIVVAALQMLWDSQGWSRGQMNRAHWLRLVDTLGCRDPIRFALPGEVDVHAAEDRVRLAHSPRTGA